jgi:hypothetical protein
MTTRAKGEYFSIYNVSDAQGNQPTQSGKMLVNLEILEGLMKVAKVQEVAGEEIKVPIDMGFWVHTAKETGQRYMRGVPSVYLKDEILRQFDENGKYIGGDSDQSLMKNAAEEAPDDIPF